MDVPQSSNEAIVVAIGAINDMALTLSYLRGHFEAKENRTELEQKCLEKILEVLKRQGYA